MIAQKKTFSTTVMVWGAITSTGKTPLVFIEKGVKILYQQAVIRDTVILWAEAHYGERKWTFVNDWVPAHKAISTKKLCKEAFPDFWDADIWPSVSPDLNAMDYGVWAILKRKACATNHKSVDALKRALLKAWDEITPEMCATIIDSFPKRINACIASKGDHFEHLLK